MSDRRKVAQNFKKFASLIKTPAVLTSGSNLTLPAGARIAVSSSLAAGAGVVKLNRITPARSQSAPALSANQKYRFDYYERGEQLNLAGGVGATVEVFVLDEWMRPKKIASRVF